MTIQRGADSSPRVTSEAGVAACAGLPRRHTQTEMMEMEWQPIETAPKDWSDVLLYEACADRNNDVGEGYFQTLEYDGDGQWHWGNNDVAHPTHWMPLPPPPVQK